MKYISVVLCDNVLFVVQTIACGFQTFVVNDVCNEIQHVGYFLQMKKSLKVVFVVDKEVAFAVSLYIEYSVFCEKRFRFAEPKRSG